MHNIAKTFFPILLLLFAAVVTAQNGKNNVGNAQYDVTACLLHNDPTSYRHWRG